MSKVYINNVPVYLVSDIMEGFSNSSRDVLQVRYLHKKDLLDTIRYIEQNNKLRKAYIIGKTEKKVIDDFLSYYKLISAAGGLVKNLEEEVLLIERNGVWDLPKGKVEKGEEIEDAAVREVEEETGARDLILNEKILPSEGQDCTWHTYQIDKKRVLKQTHWYNMDCLDDSALKPQKEEGIERVAWIKESDIPEYLGNTYGSIRDVLQSGLNIS